MQPTVVSDLNISGVASGCRINWSVYIANDASLLSVFCLLAMNKKKIHTAIPCDMPQKLGRFLQDMHNMIVLEISVEDCHYNIGLSLWVKLQGMLYFIFIYDTQI